MRRLFVLALAAAATGLSGCNKLQALIGGGEPHRKPGLWEQTLVSDRTATPMVTKFCFDQVSDQRMPPVPMAPRRAGACSKYQVSRNGADYVVDMVCGRPGGPSITRHSVLSGDFSSRYVITSTTTIAGAPDAARNGEHKSTITAVYKGACPPDIAPGQVELPSGDVVDMAQLRRGFGGGGGGGRGGGGGGGGGGPPGG